MSGFASSLIQWQKAHGRHDLPWQDSRDPYAVWLSEIMLQQTQVSSVIPYYQRFLASFPDIAALAAATQDEVLAHWSGLGYYSRARNLHRAAQQVVERHGGIFPRDFEQILALPGIGRSTAAAISAFSFGVRRAILDGNVKRVLARYCAVEGHPGQKGVEALLWQHAEALLPQQGIEAYTQGLMDLGATVCSRSRPRCGECPVGRDCLAHHQGRQNELPSPRPRKALPERETAMLLLMRQGEIFLEKRPPTGIWGGMWSFPEISPADDPQEVSLARFGFETGLLEAFPAMQHTFTHFRLHIRPQRLEVQTIQPRANQPGGVWLGLQEALGAAIPTPVRKLLLLCGKVMREKAGAS
ncbi:A/G-specific adenine glycosylase [Sulfurimicrobium lacus]|uniref:Adenine DNA glycosylase n=1 Tax=Sulfurimicrobium lacus TaxID=2715678 RepID=A0A6F8V8M4_9PROT|nr:A/G-specific adenine glycosylase [Sulfurimicrobium lacus]BCB25481.1 A/G-specific adenine glycosylase [Sulfurimicrobium lacus]